MMTADRHDEASARRIRSETTSYQALGGGAVASASREWKSRDRNRCAELTLMQSAGRRISPRRGDARGPRAAHRARG